jgi:hypothetical protein
MEKTIFKTLAAISLVAGSVFTGTAAQAVTLKTGDFLILDIKARVQDTAIPGLINLVEFERLSPTGTPTGVFSPVGDPTEGNFQVTDSRLGGIDDFANIKVGEIESFDLATQFTPNGPISTTFPFATNTFTAVDPSLTPFLTLDFDGVSGGDGLEFSISEITTSQRAILGSPTNSVVVSGKGILRSLVPDNSAPTFVDFSASLIRNTTTGRFEADGGLVLGVQTPEASSTLGLLAMGALGGASLLFKKRSKAA